MGGAWYRRGERAMAVPGICVRVCVCVCVVSGGEERPAGKACSLPVCLPGTDDIRPGDRLHG